MAAEEKAADTIDTEDGKRGVGDTSKMRKLKYSSDILIESKQ